MNESFNTIDQVYHWIMLDDDFTVLLKEFEDESDRLFDIQNIALLDVFHPSAEYPKYNHHIGFTYVILKAIEQGLFPIKKALSVKIAATIIHFGHLPLSPLCERGLLWGANYSKEVKSQINDILRNTLKCLPKGISGNYDNGDIISNINFRNLYKWFSLYKFYNDKYPDKIKNAFKNKNNKLSEYDEELIVSLILRTNKFQDLYYRFCEIDKYDYVLRDFYHLGTAKLELNLDLFLNHLKDKSKLPKLSKLVNAGENYLRENFYEHEEIRPIYKKVESYICKCVREKDITVINLLDYTDDDIFEKSKINRKLETIVDNIGSQKENYKEIHTFSKFSSIYNEPLSLKKILPYHKNSKIIEYPLKEQFIIYNESDINYYLYININSKKLKDFLKLYISLIQIDILLDAQSILLPAIFGDESYTTKLNLDFVNTIKINTNDEKYKNINQFFYKSSGKKLAEVLKQTWSDDNVLINAFENIVNQYINLESVRLKSFFRSILHNPIQKTNLRIRGYYVDIIQELKDILINDKTFQDKGALLELLVSMNIILDGWEECKYKIVFPNVTRYNSSGNMLHEYDLIVIRIGKYYDFEIDIIESSLDNSSKKEDEDIKKMTDFSRLLRRRFNISPNKYLGRLKSGNIEIYKA